MSEGAATTAPSGDSSAHDEAPIHPRSDLAGGLGWIAFGTAVLVGSVTMDRLERQDVNPYTVPGLLPGLLGILIILLGGIMVLRSWRRGALRMGMPAATADEREQRYRVGVVIALCMGYAVVLVGHGLPFWLASALYVTLSNLILWRLSRDENERRLTPRAWLKALAIGLGSGVITSVVFQELFLVRLP